MLPDLIKLFNCVAVRPDEHLIDAESVNKLGARCGYLVHPAACTVDVVRFFENQEANYNTTFYKSWKDVETLDEAEQLILQFVHYLSTYGTDYTGKTFTMNDFPERMRFTEFKILLPCTEEDLLARITSLLESGIALNPNTLDLIFEQVIIFKNKYGWHLDAERIKNKEAKARYYLEEGVMPYDAFELMRILMYVARGNALIINDSRTFHGIASNIRNISDIVCTLDDKHLEALATIFYRYKKIFLLMRRTALYVNSSNSKKFVAIVNKIRRLARKFHKPFKPNALQSIINNSIENINTALKKETSALTLIRLLNYLNSLQNKSEFHIYTIRNGNLWIGKENNKNIDIDYISQVKDVVFLRLTEILSIKSLNENGKPKTVRFPEHLELAAPVSEKMFVGAIPYGSRFKLRKNNYIGIYWRNEWGTRDFDLWVVDCNDNRIGWNGLHKTGNIMFSGDMTNANPEATEIMYCKEMWPDCTIRVHRFNGSAGSKFRLFFGSDNLKELPLNYMVNPDSIQLQEDMISENREMTVGVVADNTVYFVSLNSSNTLTPSSLSQKGISMEKALVSQMPNYTPLRDILLASGFKEYNPEKDETPDIDLAINLSKDTLISILT